jgi:hypothetical protein
MAVFLRGSAEPSWSLRESDEFKGEVPQSLRENRIQSREGARFTNAMESQIR